MCRRMLGRRPRMASCTGSTPAINAASPANKHAPSCTLDQLPLRTARSETGRNKSQTAESGTVVQTQFAVTKTENSVFHGNDSRVAILVERIVFKQRQQIEQ